LHGRVFVGKNGNQLFIPAAGYYNNSDIRDVGSGCYLWSSNHTLDDSDYARVLTSHSYDSYIFTYNRCYGMSIRPVINL
jgi:hypothetical protein